MTVAWREAMEQMKECAKTTVPKESQGRNRCKDKDYLYAKMKARILYIRLYLKESIPWFSMHPIYALCTCMQNIVNVKDMEE